MDVINLSASPRSRPGRDIVVKAINGAAQAGVFPRSPQQRFEELRPRLGGIAEGAPLAITSAAVTKGRVIASFSSGGPTPVSLQMRPT